MGEYDRSIDICRRLIVKKGDLCTWKKRNGQTFQNIPICFVEQGNFLSFISATLARDTSLPRGAYEAIMPTVEFEPEQGDMVIRSDGTQLITGPLSSFKPGQQIIMHLLKFGE